MAKYEASKTHAEKAAWDFYHTNKSDINWDLTVLDPCMMFGPAIHDLSKPDDLNVSLRLFHDVVLVEGSMPEGFLRGEENYIDVRDVAEGHIRALEVEEAGGERIILATVPFIWQDWMDVANSLSPSPIPSHPTLPRGSPGAGRGVTYGVQFPLFSENYLHPSLIVTVDVANSLSPSPIPSHPTLPRGSPGAGRGVTYGVQYDTSKEARILGIRHRSMEEIARDTLADFERRGWWFEKVL